MTARTRTQQKYREDASIMNKPTLVIMAAGLGSRFGGCKQITPVDDRGHVIIDYSIYDALRAGFGRIVCIIKPEMEADFRAAIGDRIARHAELVYAYQTLDRLPEGFAVPEGRVKPWGTAHAVLCAADAIQGDFAAINADDYYGPGSFQAACDFLTSPHGPDSHAMVGYRIENTLTENGSVSRGICNVDGGALTGIAERTRIEPREGGAAYIEGGAEHFIPAGTLVSMNLWAFNHGILDEMRARFVDFLRTRAVEDPLKAEFYLPSVPDALIREGKAQVRVLETGERWYGVTYREDLDGVKAAMADLCRRGVYPEKLW